MASEPYFRLAILARLDDFPHDQQIVGAVEAYDRFKRVEEKRERREEIPGYKSNNTKTLGLYRWVQTGAIRFALRYLMCAVGLGD